MGRLINIRRMADNERGVAMMEYALLASLIAVVSVAAVVMLGEETRDTYRATSDGFAAAGIFPGNEALEDDQDGNPFD